MSRYKLVNDARVLYLTDTLKDLCPGEWYFIHAADQRASGFFLRDNIAWMQADLRDKNEQFIKGRKCPQCSASMRTGVDDRWSSWWRIDLCDDKHVRRIIGLVVGINCRCWMDNES